MKIVAASIPVLVVFYAAESAASTISYTIEMRDLSASFLLEISAHFYLRTVLNYGKTEKIEWFTTSVLYL